MDLNKMIKNLLTTALLAVSSLFSDTSSFSVISLGDIEPSLNISTGMAYVDSLVLKNHNYASWTYLSDASFSVSASFYSHSAEDESGAKSNFDRFTFEDISFALPFGNRNVFGLSYYPVSIVDASSVTEDEFVLEESFENTTIRTLENRKGSLSDFSLIYGKGFKGLSANIEASFKLGNYDLIRRYKYTTYVGDTEVIDWEKYFENKEKTQLFHFSAGGGVIYNTPFGIRVGADFSIPLYSYVNKISEFDRTTSYGTVIEELSEEESEVKDAKWPVEFGLGLSYRVSNFVLSYDLDYKRFSGLNIGIDDSDLTDYSRNVFGISYDPRRRKYDPYYQRIVYSGYLSLEKRPYEYNDKPVYDISETLGFNLPFNDEKTNIEIKFSLTQSGSIDNNGLEDNIFKLQFNLISSDRWRLKKEKYND